MFTGETKTVVAAHLPSWFTTMVNKIPDESPIFIFELCDAMLMAFIALTWPKGKHRTCVLCVDNQAAVAALVRGSPCSTLGTLSATLFWNIAARGSTLRRAEYVHTKSNDAGAPSRWCTSRGGSACAYQSGGLPNAFSHACSSWESLRREATVFENEKIN